MQNEIKITKNCDFDFEKENLCCMAFDKYLRNVA
jgi:hypothetical protein